MNLAEAMSIAKQQRENGHDLCPLLWFLQKDSVLASLRCPEVSRDKALAVLPIGVSGYHADSVIVILDAHMTKAPTKPDGTPWERGDMQRLCDTENACAVGIITDCLIGLHARADGTSATMMATYYQPKGTSELRWLDNKDTEEAEAVVGMVPDTIRAAFRPLDKAAQKIVDDLLPDVETVDDILTTLGWSVGH